MTNTLVRSCSLCLIAVALTTVYAAEPVFWRTTTQNDFLRGDGENIAVSAGGDILLSASPETIYNSDTPFIWSLAVSADAVWIGTGSAGTITRHGTDGNVETLLATQNFNVQSLTPDGNGGIYAGLMPDGNVISIAPDGSSLTLFEPDEGYIWALTTNEMRDLFVGTGNPGRIYRIPPEGDPELFYDTGTTHVRALALDSRGNLIAGTSGPGRVIRISQNADAFVVLDSGYDEITAIRIGPDDEVFAVAANATEGNSNATSVSSATDSPSAGMTGTKGAIYRIASDGIWDLLWDSVSDTPFDAELLPNGDVVIATGPQGKIYRVDATDNSVLLLNQTQAKQVTRLAIREDGQLYFATSNPGTLQQLTSTNANTGVYVSEVHDAGMVATWGNIRWEATMPAGAGVTVATRSGNTKTPDDGWSGWSVEHVESNGSAMESPKARYFQWRATLKGSSETPLLHSVTVAYLPRNLAPEVTEITTHPAGDVFQQTLPGGDPPIAGLDAAPSAIDGTPSTRAVDSPVPTLGRRVYRKGFRTFQWKARDLNSDHLNYNIAFRPEDSGLNWNLLNAGLESTLFTWDTTTIPDGTYVLRVTASDAVTNPRDQSLSGQKETEPFVVDNSPPSITLTRTSITEGFMEFTVQVLDELSPIDTVEYTVDAEQWHVIYPDDGISDSPRESFRIRVPADTFTRLVIRAMDDMNNTATVGGAAQQP